LNIDYSEGTGESIRFADQSFDVVFCCDVLEHVRDLPKVISEISRVLNPGAFFCFDTLNRTFLSKLVAIKIWQEWKRWPFMPPNLHVWEMFIKPDELKTLLLQIRFEVKGFRGTQANVSIPKMLGYLRKRAKGEWTFGELGEVFRLVESNDMNILYMGWAVKKFGIA
jgi:2-polyprenyl-6-hydroxyphenyl methylase / 3-demethylubiquinone-9 3-methyltransferase